jgi:hypothetical protein
MGHLFKFDGNGVVTPLPKPEVFSSKTKIIFVFFFFSFFLNLFHINYFIEKKLINLKDAKK